MKPSDVKIFHALWIMMGMYIMEEQSLLQYGAPSQNTLAGQGVGVLRALVKNYVHT